MKKIFTLVMLSILTVMNASAAEETLWTGDHTLEYAPWQPDAQEPAFLTKDDFAAFEVGQRLHFYMTPENYVDGHLYRFSDYTGAANSLGVVDAYLWYADGITHNVVLEVTQGIKDAVATGGFAICGQRLHLVKVTKEVSFSDLAPRVLWTGEKALSGFVPKSGLHLNFNENGITTACNLYLLVDHAGDLRITRNSNGWEDWPSAGFNHCTGNIDANNIIKVELPQDFVDAVTEGEGDGYWHEIVLWGDGLTIKGIATTKETLLNKIHTDANGYATYSSNNTLALNNLPAGLEAYTATLTSKTLSFAQKTDAVGPETGLLFKGDADTDYFIPATTDATAVFDNALKACVAGGALASTVSYYIFVMQKATTAGSLTFKKLSTTDVTMPANKAYVQVAASVFGAGAHELNVSFGDGETTGINAVKSDGFMMNGYYDLQGRKVAQPTKGLYIVNGKKVVIK